MTFPFEVVIFGATSFVGQILVRYFAEEYQQPQTFSWAIAGRNEDKLRLLAKQVGMPELPIIIADAGDPQSLEKLCAQTQVVVSTVGPYALYGEPMVRACCDSGTDYCDLTGEVQWMYQMIARYQSRAEASGARIVHACGFDSIPSDLGVACLQRHANTRQKGPLTEIKMAVKAIKGGLSGGTFASMLNIFEQLKHEPTLRQSVSNPYALCPADHPFTARQPEINWARYDDDYDRWLVPFFMAPVNTKVVHRSNALLGAPYSVQFLYSEAMMAKGAFKARLAAAGLKAFMLLCAFAPGRALLRRFVLPKPGEGPDTAAQQTGYFDLRFIGYTQQGQQMILKLSGDRDPGYGATAKMLGQAALCLAREVPAAAGGFWTPAALLGESLERRLIAHAGLRFELIKPA